MAADDQWLPVPGFPGYEVSSAGQVRSTLAAGFGKAPTTPRVLKPCSDGHGYLRVYLRRDGRTHSQKISWLVLTAFVGPRPEGCDACHNDGNRTNDTLANLRWDTRKGNLADCLTHGTRTRGEKVGRSRLRESDVREIRQKLLSGQSQSQIAAEYGIAQTAVCKINLGKRWGWLK